MNKYRYSIVTFITNNYEVLREVPNPQDDVEYILVTDDRTLTSKTWNVVYEPLLDNKKMTGIAKALLIKYNCDKYASTDVIIRMDHSLQIINSLDELVKRFNEGNYDVMAMEHPFNTTFSEEYRAWIESRDLQQKYEDIFFEKTRFCDYDYMWNGLFMTTIQIYRKSNELTNFFNDMKECLFNNNDYTECDENDQCYNTILLMSKYNNRLNTLLVTSQLMWSKYLTICSHGSHDVNTYFSDIFKEMRLINQYGYWRGELRILEFFDK